MAATQTQNLNQQDKHMKTQNVWTNLDPGKTPGWGKPVVESFFIFLQIWKLHLQQNKTSRHLLISSSKCVSKPT